MPARDATQALQRTAARAGVSKPFQDSPPPLTVKEKGRITVDLNTPLERDLYRDLNIAARVHGVKIAELVREAMRAWLADHPVDLGNQNPRNHDSYLS